MIWHTQGSGKSVSMVFYAAKIVQQPEMENPTLVVLSDRNDLDGQLFRQFAGARDLLPPTASPWVFWLVLMKRTWQRS